MKEKTLGIVNNKYGYVILALFLYILILEDTDLFTLMGYRGEVDAIKDQKEYYQEEILSTKQAIKDLTTDQDALERFAREQHYMKRENEDLFVVLDEH